MPFRGLNFFSLQLECIIYIPLTRMPRDIDSLTTLSPHSFTFGFEFVPLLAVGDSRKEKKMYYQNGIRINISNLTLSFSGWLFTGSSATRWVHLIVISQITWRNYYHSAIRLFSCPLSARKPFPNLILVHWSE